MKARVGRNKVNRPKKNKGFKPLRISGQWNHCWGKGCRGKDGCSCSCTDCYFAREGVK